MLDLLVHVKVHAVCVCAHPHKGLFMIVRHKKARRKKINYEGLSSYAHSFFNRRLKTECSSLMCPLWGSKLLH